MHVSRRDHAYESIIVTQREGDMEKSTLICPAQGMQPVLAATVSVVSHQQKRFVEEDLLGLALADLVLVDTLPSIAFVPVEADNPRPIEHVLYIVIIYRTWASPVMTGLEGR